MGCVPGG
jgi:hypothetical protein